MHAPHVQENLRSLKEGSPRSTPGSMHCQPHVLSPRPPFKSPPPPCYHFSSTLLASLLSLLNKTDIPKPLRQTFLNIPPENFDIFISIKSRMFVKKTQRVHDFMNCTSSIQASITQRNYLFSAFATN
jgi:hypothetical protein